MLLPGWCYQCKSLLNQSDQKARLLICASCLDSLPSFNTENCIRCGGDHATGVCSSDWSKHIIRFDALFYYKAPVRQWVNSFKYSDDQFAGRILRNLLVRWIKTNPDHLNDFDIIIPAPLHPKRFRQRGFNQCEFYLSKISGHLLKTKVLIKKTQTKNQVGLSKEERESNLKNAFEVVSEVKDQRILLFDDVCSTGHTLGEMAKTLKKSGAASISALTLCRNID